MYIGLYGGTFNPVHFGHLRTAEEIRERFQMKEIVFIPSFSPPHKESVDIVDSVHRLKMVGLAITGNPAFVSSEVEVYRRGKSYSIDTIRELKEQRPDDDLAFVMGLDAFLEIETWHKFEELFAECDFIITSRPGAAKVSCLQAIPEKVKKQFKRKGSGKEFTHESGRNLVFTEVTDMAISSTDIRNKIREGTTTRYLLPRRVIDYINEHGLYR